MRVGDNQNDLRFLPVANEAQQCVREREREKHMEEKNKSKLVYHESRHGALRGETHAGAITHRAASPHFSGERLRLGPGTQMHTTDRSENLKKKKQL